MTMTAKTGQQLKKKPKKKRTETKKQKRRRKIGERKIRRAIIRKKRFWENYNIKKFGFRKRPKKYNIKSYRINKRIW
jgi:hypothetical protein